MRQNGQLSRAVRYALLSNAVVSGVAMAAPPAAETGAALQEVVVTGSRVVTPGLESISPLTTISAEELKFSGATRVEDLLNNLPQVFADQGGNLSNGSTGTAGVDLRNLGSQRTLVLINGRRLMPGDPTQNGASSPDLNQIPSALVQRVDVLTGGASAVYGADAVAGVVNFVMMDNFEGLRVDANYSGYNHQQHNNYVAKVVKDAGYAVPSNATMDGSTKDITFVLGGNFADGAGNMTGYAGYRKLAPLPQAGRDFSSCSLTSGDSFGCGGSSTSATGAFYTADGKKTVGPGGQFIPFSQGPGKYNYGPTNYYQRSDERYTAGLIGHYNFNSHATAYGEFSFMADDSNAQVAPSGAFIASGLGKTNGIPNGQWTVNCDNPLLSAQQKGILCGTQTDGTVDVLFGRRNVEGGPRNNDLRHTSFRLVTGVRGDINEVWKYDVYGQVGRTLYENYYTNDVSKTNVSNALRVVKDPTTGQLVCQSGAPGCVPYNIWTPGGVTAAAEKYISVPSLQTGSTDERIVSGNVVGDLAGYGIKMPGAKNGLILSIGAEYRQEKMNLRPDFEAISNDLAGTGNPVLPLDASLSVRELFTEARLPILTDAPFAKELSAEVGYRYSDYSLGFTTNTYKFGVDWAPVSDMRLRGSYQRAVRAPNLQELFLQRFVGNGAYADSCATSSGSPPTSSKAACARTGLSGALYDSNIPGNPAGQYNQSYGGNSKLQPEKSDTYTFGVVLTPTFLHNFNATIDYYDIKVKGVISSYGAQFTFNQCANTGNSQFCSLIHRDPNNGSLWTSPSGYIEDDTQNLGSLHTKGIDLASNYHFSMDRFGSLSFAFNGTYVQSLESEPVPGFGSYDCAGYFGNTCQKPTPKWRHKLRTSWETPVTGLDVSLNWRHINEVKLDNSSDNPLLSGSVPKSNAKLGSRDYFDVSAGWEFRQHMTARLGINNLLDKDPPVIGGTAFGTIYVNGNTYPQVYDTLGRFVFVNLTVDFK